MKTFTSLVKHFDAVMAAFTGAYGHYSHCEHCERPTVWHTNAMRGVYHCTNCKRGPS